MVECSERILSLSAPSDGSPCGISNPTRMTRSYVTLAKAPGAARYWPGPTASAVQSGPDHPLTRTTGCQLETVWAPRGVP